MRLESRVVATPAIYIENKKLIQHSEYWQMGLHTNSQVGLSCEDRANNFSPLPTWKEKQPNDMAMLSAHCVPFQLDLQKVFY
jgi:hypothetical protein